MDGDEMSTAARKMIALFGGGAAGAAAAPAELLAAGDEIEEAVDRERIATLICEMQSKEPSNL
jgi:hypothetical protein